ncbi:Gfo/Idh/MocA family protein [Paenibacillus flagellatus]|uniref:Gfo/Idh/MocA family oxidoreductase n=1 Tax=Paenibacillus flagellatus TaxID=2211139 RepID=A0A2V5K4D6_9BACL|nr:Gfo/Idh/MocA family oxidoreductase [Paenibacillus flagellatus]PYI53602.1 gfo/Idh/MocA family oxidoreductase [Paenibacillus flagellatus]
MKVAIVGCGGLGNVHASCYAAIPGVTVVGVCDIEPDLREKLAERTGAKAYASFDEMLAQSGCDVVSVTLPSNLHKPFAIQAARAGKHVICEKPIALHLDDAAEMIRECEANGVRLFVGHVVRFFPEYAQMKRQIEAGSIGRVGVAHAKRIGGHPGLRRPWFMDDAQSGGVILDLMIHDIDFFRWSLGEVRSAYGLRTVEGDVDYASATLVFESGAVANVEAYWGYPGPFTTAAEIAGSKGVIRSDSSKSVSLQVRKAAAADAGGPFVEVPQSPGYRSPFELEIEHFIDCMRENREPLVTAQDAYKALEIGLAIVESTRTGRAVQFESAAREGSR